VKPSEGKFGEAYAFEEGSIEIGQKNDFGLGDDSFTVSLWFTRDSDAPGNDVRRLISAGGGSDEKAGWALWISGKGDALTFGISDGKKRVDDLSAKDTRLKDNEEWRHAVVTVDRENKKAFLYLDGKSHEITLPFPKEQTIESSSGLSIGRISDGKDYHRGKIDDVAIWKRVLLPDEIKEIYESEKGLGEIFYSEGNTK
jgi:hypothetical protein